MKKQILALCDKEAEYTRRFCEYAGKKKDMPFEVAAFTSREKLEEFCREEDVDMLLVSESTYDIALKEIVKGDVLVLRNDENFEPVEGGSIYKYQPCESVLREVMSYYIEKEPQKIPLMKVSRAVNIKMIGFYSPVHRSLQTTLALTIGEMLAKEHKVLYLNFETFSGWEKRFSKHYSTDMSDLIYYVSNAREALFYKLRSMIERVRRLDYIPPAFSYMDTAKIEVDQWFELFKEIEKQSDYEYLILDLSDSMQGLFEIMRACCRIITLIREDGAAAAKLYHYDKILELTDYKDISDKSVRYKVPLIRSLSEDPMEYTHTELADIARELIGDMLNEG